MRFIAEWPAQIKPGGMSSRTIGKIECVVVSQGLESNLVGIAMGHAVFLFQVFHDLAVFGEFPRGTEQLGIGPDELIASLAEFPGPGLAMELVEKRLGVEGFEMARPAGHEQEDDRLRFGGKVRSLGRQRIGRPCKQIGKCQ
jgi:hypothetical protein